ncbi:MAG TPA: sigma-54 dependent transcriptional regulator [Gemmatimonadales bacterium]|nr:sigma-54 dependent transcriptional regulator [Gemmatimonadales bacterium]
MKTVDTSVYVVDDDASVRDAVSSLIRSAGFRVRTFESAHEFLATPRAEVPSCLVLDVHLPGLNGLDLQRELAKADVHIPIIFLTGHGDIPTSVRAIKAGALEFLTKPFADEDLLNAIRDGIAQDRRSRAVPQPAGVIGSSRPWRQALAHAAKVGATEATVLLTGESGTGKEVIAHLIHDTSRRAGGPFVALNCAALPEALLESELFGYEKGAFTGAVVARPGRVEQAAGGTLFLDEVGEMTPAVQAKFLRVLQEREFQRLGGTRVQKANVRVIAATNRDLHAALGRGELREDLYYRLHVFAICLPPLRERPEDIPALVEHFITALGPALLGRPAAGISREAHERLLAHSWPGNVRELRNAVERALILSDGEMITPEHLPAPPETPPEAEAAPRESLDLETTERELVERALRHAGQNKAKAARLLGLTRTKLYTRMQRFGLS